MRVLIHTLGCKVNQADSEALRAMFETAGMTVLADSDLEIPDAVIINSCAVTHRAEQDARKLVRRARRTFPQARIVLGGCLPKVRPGVTQELIQADAFFTPNHKADMVAWLTGKQMDLREDESLVLNPLPRPAQSRRARPLLLIQQGCNQQCSYCVVPEARGPERSMPPDLVRREIASIAQREAPEIVLTGIHLGRYGRYLAQKIDLAGLLKSLCQMDLGPKPPRLRLSSLDPDEISEDLAAMFQNEMICPHVHLALQSADDHVLKNMNRTYNASTIFKAVQMLRQARPSITLGSDILVGFPTEDEPAFERTHAMCRDLSLSYLHVFPYSPRPGTPAYSMRTLSPGVVKDRAAILREQGRVLRNKHMNSLIGQSVEIVVERLDNRGRPRGTTEFYHQAMTSASLPYTQTGQRLGGEVASVQENKLIIVPR